METKTSSTPNRLRDRAARPIVPPLKAERIQLILLLLDRGNRPYDFRAESAAERRARLEAGWRKRVTGGRRLARRSPTAA